jgi:hypothetical protein
MNFHKLLRWAADFFRQFFCWLLLSQKTTAMVACTYNRVFQDRLRYITFQLADMLPCAVIISGVQRSHFHMIDTVWEAEILGGRENFCLNGSYLPESGQQPQLKIFAAEKIKPCILGGIFSNRMPRTIVLRPLSTISCIRTSSPKIDSDMLSL